MQLTCYVYCICINSTSHLLSRPVSVSAVLRHRRLSSDAPVFQPSAIKLFGRCFPTAEHSAAERHVGIVSICFQETFEDPSLQSFFPWISCSACAVTFIISDTIIDLFTYLLTASVTGLVCHLCRVWHCMYVRSFACACVCLNQRMVVSCYEISVSAVHL